MQNIINRACIIAADNDRDAISINDLIEARLDSIAGKINKQQRPAWYKDIVVTHEYGHALVLQTLLNMVKKDKPWQRGPEISLITNDSRGNSGGAMHMMPGENMYTESFESMFMNLACSYGEQLLRNALWNGR